MGINDLQIGLAYQLFNLSFKVMLPSITIIRCLQVLAVTITSFASDMPLHSKSYAVDHSVGLSQMRHQQLAQCLAFGLHVHQHL